MYFRFFSPHFWSKRSAVQPQTIYSEFPKEKWCRAEEKEPLLGRFDSFQLDPSHSEKIKNLGEDNHRKMCYTIKIYHYVY